MPQILAKLFVTGCEVKNGWRYRENCYVTASEVFNFVNGWFYHNKQPVWRGGSWDHLPMPEAIPPIGSDKVPCSNHQTNEVLFVC